jgi:hypothetical protein
MLRIMRMQAKWENTTATKNEERKLIPLEACIA